MGAEESGVSPLECGGDVTGPAFTSVILSWARKLSEARCRLSTYSVKVGIFLCEI